MISSVDFFKMNSLRLSLNCWKCVTRNGFNRVPDQPNKFRSLHTTRATLEGEVHFDVRVKRMQRTRAALHADLSALEPSPTPAKHPTSTTSSQPHTGEGREAPGVGFGASAVGMGAPGVGMGAPGAEASVGLSAPVGHHASLSVYDYLRDEVAFRLVDRLYDIKGRRFPVAVDWGCGRSHIARHLTTQLVDLLYQCDSPPVVVQQAARIARYYRDKYAPNNRETNSPRSNQEINDPASNYPVNKPLSGSE